MMIREVMSVLSEYPDICNYDVDRILLQRYPNLGCKRFHSRVNDCLNTLRRQKIAEDYTIVSNDGKTMKLWRLSNMAASVEPA